MTRLVEVSTGRAVVTARWNISVGAVDVLFWLAIQAANGRSNPLEMMDGLAASWRELDIEIALEPIE